MELEEFESLWNKELNQEVEQNKHSTDYLNNIIMNTNSTLGKIQKTNRFWWITWLIVGPVFLGLTIVNIILKNLHPQEFEHIENGYFFILILFALVGTLIYYMQYKTFSMAGTQGDLKSFTTKSIDRFSDYYKIMMALSVIFLPFVLYTVMTINRGDMLSTELKVIFSILGTLAIIAGTHLYYVRTYFRWITNLKNNLKELKEEK